MDEIILRTGDGEDVGVELQDADDDGEPLWAVHAKALLTTTELLALAHAILEHQPHHAPECAIERDAGEPGSSGLGCTCGADISAANVARTLKDMRARASASRHYTCLCGAAIVVAMWPNLRVECSTCGTVFRECGDEGSRVLRKLGSVDDVTQAVIPQQNKVQT